MKAGLHPMPNAQALAALEHLVSTDRASAVVASSIGTRFALSTKRAERGLCFLKCDPRSRTENLASTFEEIRRRGIESQPSTAKRFASTSPRYFNCAPPLPGQ